jgi:hypothetical protein
MKECSFYPEVYEYPVGLFPKQRPFYQIHRLAMGLVTIGKDLMAAEKEQEGREYIEAAVRIGIQLAKDSPVYIQRVVGLVLQSLAAEDLALSYPEMEEKETRRTISDFSLQKRREQRQLNQIFEELKKRFINGRIELLMEYAREGDTVIHRAHAMRLLALLKIAGQNQPLRADISDIVPVECRTTFSTVTAGDSEEIADLFRDIAGRDRNVFLRKHAGALLMTSLLDLKEGIEVLLIDDVR